MNKLGSKRMRLQIDTNNSIRTIAYVTSSRLKAAELSHILKEDHLGIIIRPVHLENILEIESPSQLEVVKNKADQCFKRLGSAILVDDTGLYLSNYKCFPGPCTKNVEYSLGAEG